MRRLCQFAGCIGLVCALTLVMSGCGTSQYNANVGRGVARLRNEAKYKGLYAPTQIPGSNFSIRVPVIFLASYTPGSGHPDDGDKISPERMQPPFLSKDDNVKLTYEGFTTDPEGRTVPYYCYLASAPAKPGEVEILSNGLQAALRQLFPSDPPAAWEPVDAETPDGKAIHWKKIRATGPQQFFVKASGGGPMTSEKLPGVLEFWMHDAGENVVMVVWRAPSSVEGPQDGEFNIVGGVPVPVPNAKPDFAKWPALTAGTLEGGTPAP